MCCCCRKLSPRRPQHNWAKSFLSVATFSCSCLCHKNKTIKQTKLLLPWLAARTILQVYIIFFCFTISSEEIFVYVYGAAKLEIGNSIEISGPEIRGYFRILFSLTVATACSTVIVLPLRSSAKA